MIYLFTGAPGTGKTAGALALLQTLPQYPDKCIVVGVREYKGGGQYFERLPENFDFAAYPGFVFLIDEVQDYFPSRVAGRPAPPALEFLPKHRHIGQDYILTCQFPTQLDVKLRHLIGRHVHLEKEVLGVFAYEAGRCVENVKDFPPDSRRPRGGISGETKGLYVSMEGEETKLQKSRPPIPRKLFWILGVVLVMFGVAGYYLMHSESIFSKAVKGEGKPGEFNSQGDLVIPKPAIKESQEDIKPLRLIRHPLELGPGNSDYPELAKQPRLPVSCVANQKRCVCFDQALQRIENMGQERCRGLVEGRDSLVAAWGRDDTPRLPLYPPLPVIENKPRPANPVPEGQPSEVGTPQAQQPPA